MGVHKQSHRQMCDLRRLADLEPTLRANGRKDLERLLKKHLASTVLAPSSSAADDGGGTLGMCVERRGCCCLLMVFVLASLRCVDRSCVRDRTAGERTRADRAPRAVCRTGI